MRFSIRMGIPEMLALWERLCQESRAGSISKADANLYKKWGQALKHLAADPFYPSLHTHEIQDLTRRYGRKVWQSYLENRTSRAMRMYWVYGPRKKDITIIALDPHPEDKKTGAYDKVMLSKLEPLAETMVQSKRSNQKGRR